MVERLRRSMRWDNIWIRLCKPVPALDDDKPLRDAAATYR